MSTVSQKNVVLEIRRQETKRRRRFLALLGCMVVIATAVALMVPALSMTRGALVCEIPEHQHSDACYEQVLACGLEEGEGHQHSDACYEQQLVCGLDEHAHSDACYEAPAAASDDVADQGAGSGEEGSAGTVATQAAVGQNDDASARATDAGSGADANTYDSSADVAAGQDGANSAIGVMADDGVENGAGSPSAGQGAEGAELASSMPAQTFAASLEDADGNVVMVVKVNAPEDAFPANTLMKIDGVLADDVRELVVAALNDELGSKLGQVAGDAAALDELGADGSYVSWMDAVDITFFGPDGAQVQPARKVEVRISAGEIRNMLSPVVVHVNEVADLVKLPDGTATMSDGQLFQEVKDKYLDAELVKKVQLVNELEDDESTGNENTLKFQAEKFSPYVFVELQEGLAAELTQDEGQSGEVGESIESEELGDAGSDVDPDVEAEEAPQLITSESEMPAQSFAEELKGDNGKVVLTVSVEAPEGTLPAGATMVAKLVDDDEVIEAAKDEAASGAGVSAKHAKALAADITFLDADGNEVEPAGDVHVTMAAPLVSDQDKVAVVHVADDLASEVVETAEVDVDQQAVAFDAAQFSVYALVYTVDFYWEVDGKVYETHIGGGGATSLRDLVKALHILDGRSTPNEDADKVDTSEAVADSEDSISTIAEAVDYAIENGEAKPSELTEFINDVNSVTFSDESLIAVQRVTESTTVGELKQEQNLRPEYTAELDAAKLAEWDARMLTAPDWALISLKPFTSEETLTVIMGDGAVFKIKVTDNQATDPWGLNNEVFVITTKDKSRSLKAQETTYNGKTVMQAQYPSSDTINQWRFEYDHEVFDGQGGYYLVSVLNGKYLNVDNGNITFADSKDVGAKVATPFAVEYDQANVEYRISTDRNLNSSFLTFANGSPGSFVIDNNKSNENNLLSFRSADNPVDNPGTVGTWDILSDGITLKLFDYTGTVTRQVDDWENGWWEQWPQNRWYQDQSGNWVTGEYHPGTKDQTDEIDDVWGSTVSNQQLRAGSGINYDRSLLFSGSGLGNGEAFNDFTGSRPEGTSYYSGYAYQDIVKYNLGSDEFPILQSDNIKTDTDRNSGGSLAYLFNDTNIANAKTVYAGEGNEGLQGLLRKDEDGYYYYSSEQNFAKLVGSEVILYSDTYKKNIGSSDVKTEKIGFFPFSDYDAGSTEEKGPSGSVYNHQFGMTISSSFVYPKDGVVPDTNKQMTFTFSGDDDVWVYVDGVLVLDLGGVHQPIRGEINFATGDVDIYEFGSDGREYKSNKSTTIDAMFAKASQEAGASKTFDRTEFSAHSLDFFYLERGGCDSNCSISFNLLMMKTLTVAKKLNGLTPAERAKYLNDEFLYELAFKHNADGVQMEYDDEADYWSNAASWRGGFETYNTVNTEQQDEDNYTIKTLPNGEEELGIPIKDGQVRLKADESLTITHLPRTDIFYLAEEDELDMQQFETPHAERLYQDSNDLLRHEEEVRLHEDTAAGGSHESDWETRPYALQDTERLVYTNTLQEKNLDVEKVWADGSDKHTGDNVKFKLKATVLDGSENGTDYAMFMTQYNSTHGTSYSTNINAQWTQSTSSGVSTTTADVLGEEFTLNTANDWRVLFEHLPKKTQDPNGTGKEIVYTVEEVNTATGYDATVGNAVDADKVYLDIFKFWPDDNSNHRGNNAETFTVNITDSNGNVVKAVKDTNGEWRYTNQANEGTTSITFGADASNEMFDYAARVNGLPRYDENGDEITYTITQVNDADATTTGLVAFTRPVKEIEILNTPRPVDITIKKVDSENAGTLLPGATFQLYSVNDEGADVAFENDAFDIVGEGENAKHTGPFTVESGTKVISGLYAGRYHLKELTAPAGYIITSADTYFTVNSDGIAVLTNAEGVAIQTMADSPAFFNGLELTIKNESGAELPNTGGPGATPFYLLGALCIGVAATLLLRRRPQG